MSKSQKQQQRQSDMREAQRKLDTNNAIYRDGSITRRQWVDRNCEIVEWCKQHDLNVTLHSFAVTHTDEASK